MQHHAYYIEGSLAEVEAYKKELQPFWTSIFDKFGIEDARELVALAGLKNYEASVFLIAVSSITSEAQQALLKLFEEPQQGTTFYLLVPHGALLPTLRSRMLPFPQNREIVQKNSLASPAALRQDEENRGLFSGQALEFLRAPAKARSDIIAKLLKDDEGLRERVLNFVNALEAALVHDVQKNAQALQDIAKVRDYLHDRSPSIKMLLEHLALCLPKS